MKFGKLSALFSALGGLLILYFLIPVANIFLEQFTFNLGNFIQTLTDFTTLKAVWISVFAAFISILIALGFGIPLAYMLARRKFPGKDIIEGIIDLPMAIPHTVAGIALLSVLGSRGFIGNITQGIVRFEYSFLGIVAAMTFVSAPFLINSAKEGFESIDSHLENVARNLGASEWQTFQKVALPLAFPEIFSGAFMSWARAISEFSAIIMLVGFYPMIAPGLIWSRFYGENLMSAMAVAVVLLLVVLPTFIILRYFRGKLFDKY